MYLKVGLALGSGGARGFAHIGVIKTLEKYSIPIHYIAGSSIGAVVGVHYARYRDSEKLVEDAYKLNRKKGIGMFDPVFKGGFLRGNKVENYIANLIGNPTFESLKIPFAAVATNLNTAESVVLTKGDLLKSIRASISVPGFFQPILYNGIVLADGGLSTPVPDNVARAMGADFVIAVNLDKYLNTEEIKIPSLSAFPIQTVNILRHNLALKSTSSADILIEPNVYNVGILGLNYFVNKKKIEELIQEGERATEEQIPIIIKLLKSKKIQTSFKERVKNIYRMIIK